MHFTKFFFCIVHITTNNYRISEEERERERERTRKKGNKDKKSLENVLKISCDSSSYHL